MKRTLATDRLQRLRATKGMGLSEITTRKLVIRTDWQIVLGAGYPTNNWWKRDSNGQIRYHGPIVSTDHRRKGV